MNEYDKIWSQCLAYIQSQINDNVAFETFYANSKLAYIGQGKARIVVETQFGDVVLRNRLDLIIEALKQVTTQQYEVEILTQDALAKREEEKKQAQKPLIEIKDNLIDNFVFDQFVVGDSNKIAQAASLATAINPGQSFKPAFYLREFRTRQDASDQCHRSLY